MRVGIIDLGTNTFHCLIATVHPDGTWEDLHRERRFVKLAEDGIDRIGAAAFARGIATLVNFRQVLTEYGVENVRAFGTAALRTASNGDEFVGTAQQQAGIDISLISGDQEARYIYLGVAQAVPMTKEHSLIMDIGGGSVEFIIASSEGVLWQQSFPVGVAVLYRSFHHGDPIPEAEIRQVLSFLQDQLRPLATALAEYPASRLIGAAGTFDVLATLLGENEPTPYSIQVSLQGFDALYFEILAATSAQRHAHAGIPDDRADMIVVALLLVRYILDLADIQQLVVSRFSMKEGMLADMA